MAAKVKPMTTQSKPRGQSIIRTGDSQGIARAVDALQRGLLVAFPTETVYGLGGDATCDQAVAAIFAAKKRPHFNPLIIHFPDADAAEQHVIFDQRARLLAEKFWPGPLTLVLKRQSSSPISLVAASGLETLAVRVPAPSLTRRVLQQVNRPIAAPSANPSGRISPTTADHVAAGLGDHIALILDGGPCSIGLESSVIDLGGDTATLLRPGAVLASDISAVIGTVSHQKTNTLRSPGCLPRHYAPRLPLRLNATMIHHGEALLSFGPHHLTGFVEERNLSPQGNMCEAAANLFSMLRELESSKASRIAVMPVPRDDLGDAINDRLRRAATPDPSSPADSQEGAPDHSRKHHAY